MTIDAEQTLPDATLLAMGPEGPEPVRLSDRLRSRKVVLFGLPGAYTGTCTTAHMPSFIRTRDGFAAKGVDEIICISVNDPFVLAAWGRETGADAAGITLLADAEGAFTRAIGMEFSAPARGLIGRAKRFAMVVEDGRVRSLHTEAGPGICEATGGEALLATL
ncbi:MAG: peroxiredoxin [Tranquillimonas sp.]|jgi:peroxiredoxin